MRVLWSLFLFLVSLGFISGVAGMALLFWLVGYYGRDLPDYRQLQNYEPPVVTRVHTGDGRLMAEFSTEKRVFVPIDEIPDLVIQAFLSAEDKNFYRHKGIDYTAIARAIVVNLKNAGQGRRLVGASTITQQVAKNFLLSSEVSYERKVKEAILAYRLEQAFSKRRLLELYLNQIYLGSGAYGVGAAALEYFGKSLDELSIQEAAYLGALPKAPSNYHPVKDHDAALARRNWVIGRMVEDGAILSDQASLAQATPLEMLTRVDDVVQAPYFAEEIRRELEAHYGQESLYRGGLSVRSTIDPGLQVEAEKALRAGLMDYDRKKGWRGPVTHLASVSGDWPDRLAAVSVPEGMLPAWKLALVTGTQPDRLVLGFVDGSVGRIDLADLKWVHLPESKAEITQPGQAFSEGDVLMVEAHDGASDRYDLRQVPEIQGAIVAMDPHTGRVLAMQGGWAFDGSEFNRVTQARRQPGSAFKPFIYLAALDSGFTPASLILDAPITYTDALGRVWRPENYSGEYYGPSTIRVGVEKSRNLMTVRLSDRIGMDKVVAYAKKFGVSDTMQPHLANALGSTETTLLRLTNAYAMLVNGGKQVSPVFVDRIQDRRGQTIFRADARVCDSCGPRIRWDSQDSPDLSDSRVQIQDPRTAYQMVSILEGVVQRGTAKSLAALGRPVAGKTGTTNESRDVWFIGFTPDLVAGVFVGYDQPRPLGKKETGASLAVPIFGDFIKAATQNQPPVPFRIPPGIRQVMVDAETGARTRFGTPGAIWESFIEGTEPAEGYADTRTILDNMGTATATSEIGELPVSDVPVSPFSSGMGPAPENRTPAAPLPAEGNVIIRSAPRGGASEPPLPPPVMDESTTGTGGIY